MSFDPTKPEPRKINKYLLDESLQQELDNKINQDDGRLKADKITYDDLAQNVRQAIQNSSVNPSIGYNDTELRGRIISLEDNQVPKSNVFNKSVDQVTLDLLDPSLRAAIAQVNANANNLSDIQTTIPDKTAIRYTADKIGPADLAPDLLNKIQSAYSYYQSVIPDGNVAEITDAGAIMAAINTLTTDKADKSELAGYRRTNIKIGANDLEDSIANSIAQISSLQSALGDAVTSSQLNDYRKKTEVITELDLESALASKINTAASFADSTMAAISQAVDASKEDIIANVKAEVAGNYEFVRPSGTTEGSEDDHNIVTMPYRRLILSMKAEAYDNSSASDGYALSTVLYWLLKDGIGDKYQRIPQNIQKAICQFNGIPKDLSHSVDPASATLIQAIGTYVPGTTYYLVDGTEADTSSYVPGVTSVASLYIQEGVNSYGYKYGQFSLTDALLYIFDKIATIEANATTSQENITTLQGKVTTLESKVTTLEGKVTTLEGKVTSLEDRMDDAEDDIQDVKGDIQTINSNIQDIKDDIRDIQDDIETYHPTNHNPTPNP